MKKSLRLTGANFDPLHPSKEPNSQENFFDQLKMVEKSVFCEELKHGLRGYAWDGRTERGPEGRTVCWQAGGLAKSQERLSQEVTRVGLAEITLGGRLAQVRGGAAITKASKTEVVAMVKMKEVRTCRR